MQLTILKSFYHFKRFTALHTGENKVEEDGHSQKAQKLNPQRDETRGLWRLWSILTWSDGSCFRAHGQFVRSGENSTKWTVKRWIAIDSEVHPVLLSFFVSWNALDPKMWFNSGQHLQLIIIPSSVFTGPWVTRVGSTEKNNSLHLWTSEQTENRWNYGN